MLARLPGVIAAGSSVAYPTSNVDFAPTFLEAAGVAATYGLDGTSWWGAVAGAASAELAGRVCIVSEIDMDRAVVCPSYGLKYISKASDEDGDASYPGSNDPVQLYDLVADPTEQVNVASEASYADTVTLLAAYIACHQSDTARVGSSACDPEALVQEETPGPTPTTSPSISPTNSDPTMSPSVSSTTSDPTLSPSTSPSPTPSPTAALACGAGTVRLADVCVVDTTACTEGTMLDAVTRKCVPDLAHCYGVRTYWGADRTTP